MLFGSPKAGAAGSPAALVGKLMPDAWPVMALAAGTAGAGLAGAETAPEGASALAASEVGVVADMILPIFGCSGVGTTGAGAVMSSAWSPMVTGAVASVVAPATKSSILASTDASS